MNDCLAHTTTSRPEPIYVEKIVPHIEPTGNRTGICSSSAYRAKRWATEVVIYIKYRKTSG